jgi:hypothetical protein
MRARTLLLLAAVLLVAPACAGRLLSGTVSLSPGETVWSGQAPPAAGEQAQAKPAAKPADRPRSAQSRARGDRNARGAQSRRTTPATAGTPNPVAVEATGTAGESPAAPPAAPAQNAAAASPGGQHPATIEAGLVRQFQSTPGLVVVALGTVAIVTGIFVVQRYRRPRPAKGTLHRLGDR